MERPRAARPDSEQCPPYRGYLSRNFFPFPEPLCALDPHGSGWRRAILRPLWLRDFFQEFSELCLRTNKIRIAHDEELRSMFVLERTESYSLSGGDIPISRDGRGSPAAASRAIQQPKEYPATASSLCPTPVVAARNQRQQPHPGLRPLRFRECPNFGLFP